MTRIEIYISEFCPFCWGAKRLLKDKSVEFTLYSVNEEPRKRRKKLAPDGVRSVPQNFVGQPPIGGFDELTALILNGDLGSPLGLRRRHSG